MCLLMTDAKIFDAKGNEFVKAPFFHGNAIMDDTVNVIVHVRCWLREVDGRKLFLPVMARCYCIFDFQRLSIARAE